MLVKYEQNCMVRTIQNFDLFNQKRLTIFDKVLTQILEYVQIVKIKCAVVV